MSTKNPISSVDEGSLYEPTSSYHQAINREAEEVLSASPNAIVQELSELWIMALREASRESVRRAAFEFNVSVEFAQAVADARYDSLLSLSTNGLCSFTMAGSEESAMSVLKGEGDQSSLTRLGSLLAGKKAGSKSKQFRKATITSIK